MKIKTMIQLMISFYVLLIILVSAGTYSLSIKNDDLKDLREVRFEMLAKYDTASYTDEDTTLLDATKKSINTLNVEIEANLRFIYAVMILALFSFIFAYIQIRKKILLPIKDMNRVITLYQNGNHDVEEFSSNNDEIGFMVKEFFIMKKMLDEEYTAVEKLALTDSLTGILNRRAFFELSEKILKLTIRKKSTFSILIMDIDYFKKVNDVYGHFVGDDILNFLVSIVQKEIRESDIFARFGGEEFILLLPETDTDGAYQLAEKIRVSLEENPFVENRLTVPITTSIGVSELKDEKFLRELIHRADEALYRAKGHGRNRVEIS